MAQTEKSGKPKKKIKTIAAAPSQKGQRRVGSRASDQTK
jgi:hypothetical protein